MLFVGTVAVTVAIYFLTTPGGLSARRPAQFIEGSSALEDVKEFKRKVISTLKIEKTSAVAAKITVNLPAEICQQYQSFEIVLEAEGVALNGEPIRISKTKNCSDLDPETLEVTWQVALSDQPPLLDVQIQTWNIKSLSFGPQPGVNPIKITGYEFIYVLGSPPAVHFNP